MNMSMSLETARRIEALADRLTVHIFYGQDYPEYHLKGENKYFWDVHLAYKGRAEEGETKLEVKRKASTLEEALDSALREVELIATRGFGASALQPMIENSPTKQKEKQKQNAEDINLLGLGGQKMDLKPEDDDNIPF